MRFENPRRTFLYFFLPIGILVALSVCGTTLMGLNLASGIPVGAYQKMAERPLPRDVVIVGIDDRSIEELGYSMKYRLASEARETLVAELLKSTPRALLVDLNMFEDSDNYSNDWYKNKQEQERVFYFKEEERAFTDLRPLQFNPDQGKQPLLLPIYYSEGTPFIAPKGGPSSFSIFSKILKIDQLEPALATTNYSPNYYSPKGGLPYIPLHELLSTPELRENLHNKIVFLGIKSYWFQKGVSSEWRQRVPGLRGVTHTVDIQATTLANMLDGSWIRKFSTALSILLVLATLVLVAGIAAYLRLDIAVAALIAICWLAVYAVDYSFASLFLWNDLLVLMVVLPALTIFIAIFMSIQNSRTEPRAQERLVDLIPRTASEWAIIAVIIVLVGLMSMYLGESMERRLAEETEKIYTGIVL